MLRQVIGFISSADWEDQGLFWIEPQNFSKNTNLFVDLPIIYIYIYIHIT